MSHLRSLEIVPLDRPRTGIGQLSDGCGTVRHLDEVSRTIWGDTDKQVVARCKTVRVRRRVSFLTFVCFFEYFIMHSLNRYSLNRLVNPLIPTLKSQRNGPLYSNTVICTLAVDVWAVTFGTAKYLGGPPRCNKCNSPPISGQCTNFILFDVAL